MYGIRTIFKFNTIDKVVSKIAWSKTNRGFINIEYVVKNKHLLEKPPNYVNVLEYGGGDLKKKLSTSYVVIVGSSAALR